MSMFRRRLLIYQALMNKSGNIVYPGLIAAWSTKGKTNDDEDRAILKDLTGNGHDITLNGFAFSRMSGYGGYSINFKNEYNSSIFKNRAEGTVTQNKIVVTSIKNVQNFFEDEKTSNIHPSYKIKATGVSEDLYIKYMYSSDKSYDIKIEGIHTIPESEAIRYVGFRANKIVESCNIVIELIPEYPDALVFDGVNDYGLCKNIPLLEDYTIIAKRKDCSGGCLFNKGVNTKGAFILEGFGFVSNTYSFGRGQNKNLLNNDIITWQNKNSYNQQNLIIGNDLDRTNQIIIGKLNDSDIRVLKGAFYCAYLFDRSLDEQEIKAFIRKYIDPKYLLPSEIPTPDCYYDFSQGSNDDENRDTIKDYSGNGNDAVAHNFAWRGMSGYGGHNCYFSSNSGVDRYEGSFTNDKAHITKIIDEVNKNLINIHIINNFNIKISGLTGNNLVRIGPPNVATLSLSNGTHKIDSSLFPEGYNYSIGILGDIGECDITIEFIPEYPGALSI